MPEDTDRRRHDWLHIARAVTLATTSRTDRIRSGCVTATMTGDDEPDDRKRIDTLSRRILMDLVQLSNIEAEEPNLGARAVLVHPPTKCIQHAFVMMLAARMSGEVSREVNLVSDVIDHVAARHPDMALEIRQAFRHDGQLRPLVWFSKADTLDQSRIQLTETSFNKALALTPDIEFGLMAGEGRRSSR